MIELGKYREIDMSGVARAGHWSLFQQKFICFAEAHHEMMVERGFHEPPKEMHRFVGVQVCARIRGQSWWLEDVRNGVSVDNYRTSYDYDLAVRDNERKSTILLKCALIATEITELTEEVIKSDIDKDAAAEECADIVLRVMDLCEREGWDLAEALVRKMEKNSKRAYKHGKAF